MRRIVPPPAFRKATALEAAAVPSFAQWYSACMYDPVAGYYSSGRVMFGDQGDFNTFPQRLSPVFGWMVCDAIQHLLAPILERVASDTPITLLEFGGGNGDLAFDILSRLESIDPALTQRVTYRIVEASEALRKRQRERLQSFVGRGRAEVVAGTITNYEHPDQFVGVAFANEVLDALPCEQLHVTDEAIYRTHVATTAPLPPEGPGLPEFVEELHVDIRDGWIGPDGVVTTPPEDLLAHIERLRPLIADLRDAALTPVDYYWSRDACQAMETFCRLGEHDTMAGLIIDYGGTSRQALDRTMRPHLRVYGRDESLPRSHNPYTDPGAVDITWDQDFTGLAAIAARRGLNVHYGHQRILEPSAWRLDEGDALQALASIQANLGFAESETAARELIDRFRRASAFRTLILTAPDAPLDSERFGPSDAWDGIGLATIRREATRAGLVDALTEVGFPELSLVFGRCCDIAGTLADLGRYEDRVAVRSALERHGLLTTNLP